MPPIRRIDRKLLNSRKVSSNKRLSDTPKKGTPSKAGRNILSQHSDMNEVSDLVESSNRRSSIISQTIPSTIDTSDLLKSNWKVYRVSPVYNFSKNKLKTYARKLKEAVAHHCRNENVNCDCSFQYEKLSLLGQSYDIIQVILNDNKNKYKGYFLSSEENQSKEEVSNIKLFPVLLVQGGGKILQQVHNILCKFFDCVIYPIRFTFKALTTFFAHVSQTYIKDVSDFAHEAVTLHYKIPGCLQSDSIRVAVSLAAASTVFAVFFSQFGGTLSDTQIVSGYYDRIIRHILNVYEVDLSYAVLNKVIFPGFAASSEGWVKFTSEEIMKKTLPIIGEFSELESILH